MEKFKIHHWSGDHSYCGSFKECCKCDVNVCPLPYEWNYCEVAETETDIFYISFFSWPNLDYDVAVADRDPDVDMNKKYGNESFGDFVSSTIIIDKDEYD